jgi:hypothetical protein
MMKRIVVFLTLLLSGSIFSVPLFAKGAVDTTEKLTEKLYGFINALQGALLILVVVVCVAGIISLVSLSILKIKEKNANIAILASTLGSCLLMMPITAAFNNFVTIQVEGKLLSKTKQELQVLAKERQLKEKEQEILNAQITISKQTIEIEGLNNNVRQLESAKLSVQGMTKISELALTATNLKSTQMYTERTGLIKEKGKPGWFGTTWLFPGENSNYYNEYLTVVTHDIIAKQGVDLKEIKLSNSSELPNTIIVSGITPKYIGSSKNVPTYELQELRTHILDYNTDKELSVQIRNDSASVREANEFAHRKEIEFQTRLSEGLETSFLDESVVELAKQFITIALAPLGRNIVFTETIREGALPLLDYIQSELDANIGKNKELESINEKLIDTIDVLSEERQSLMAEADGSL